MFALSRGDMMHAPIKYLREGALDHGEWRLAAVQHAEQDQPPAGVDAEVVRQAAAEVLREDPSRRWVGRVRPDSLCPTCTREARQAILDGKKDVSVLLNEKVGEIKATILERGGKIPDGEGLPAARPLRGRDGESTPISSSTSKRCFPAATFARTTTRSCTTTAAAPSSTAANQC